MWVGGAGMCLKRILTYLAFAAVILGSFGFTDGPEYPHVPGGADLRIDPPINSIAWQDHDFENAAVAYSSKQDQFLVVFESDEGNGDINGRFVDGSNGNLLGPYPFNIASSLTQMAGNPDVAYDPDEDLFLVVYDEGIAGNRHVWGRLVHGSYQNSGDQLASNNLSAVSTTTEDEFDPAVAYNKNDSQYIVVFNYSENAVYAQRLDSGRQKAGKIGDAIEILTRSIHPVITPDVAWGDGENDRFLAVFSDYDSANSRYVTKGAYLFDTEQLGAQIEHDPCWVAPYNIGPHPLTNSTTKPSVAFDPLYNTFYVVFEYAEGPSKKSVYGLALEADNESECFGIFKSDHAFPVEAVFDEGNKSHIHPHIAHSKIGNFMYATYVTLDPTAMPENDPRIYLRTLYGEGEEYMVTSRLEVRAGTLEERVLHPAAAAGINGKAMLVWQQDDAASGWDILGRFVIPYWNWLPLVIKD